MKILKSVLLSLRRLFLRPAIPVFLLVLVVGVAGYFFHQYQKTQAEVKRLKQDPQTAALEETKKLISKVGELVTLPEGEAPTVATISDKEKLKDQPFFAKAKNGDKLIIYTQARKAILYDPVANKIVDIVTLSLATASVSPTPASVRIALYNGTNTGGLTKIVEEDLKGKISNVEVVAKEDANKKDYTKTLVIDLSGNQKELAEEIAKVVKGEVADLPEGETKPEAEILIIIGSEF